MKYNIIKKYKMYENLLYVHRVAFGGKYVDIHFVLYERVDQLIGNDLSYAKEHIIVVRNFDQKLLADSIEEYIDLVDSYEINLVAELPVKSMDRYKHHIVFCQGNKNSNLGCGLKEPMNWNKNIIIETYQELDNSDENNIDFYVYFDEACYAFTAFTPKNIKKMFEDKGMCTLNLVTLIKRIDQMCLEDVIKRCLLLGIDKVGIKQKGNTFN